jgi:hypothetical protein
MAAPADRLLHYRPPARRMEAFQTVADLRAEQPPNGAQPFIGQSPSQSVAIHHQRMQPESALSLLQSTFGQPSTEIKKCTDENSADC